MTNLPRHVAITMDGNGRWAAARGLARTAGHKAGLDPVRMCIQECTRRKVAARKRVDAGDVTLIMLDRSRHEEGVAQIREAGARIRFITDIRRYACSAPGWRDSNASSRPSAESTVS